jgi:hypothetical protein
MEHQAVTDWLTIIVAVYAAVVATGALALEVRRWAAYPSGSGATICSDGLGGDMVEH